MSDPTETRAARIERTLRDVFQPVHLELHDDSWQHRGHAGAQGGSHFRVVIASAAFEGKSLVEQHKAVQDALRDMIRSGEVHALQMKTQPASRFTAS